MPANLVMYKYPKNWRKGKTKPVFKMEQSIWRRRQWQPTPVLLPGKSHGQRSLVGCSPWDRKESGTRPSDFTFTFHFHGLEKETATHSSILAWRIPGTREPGGLLSMGSHRVLHDWSELAAAAAAAKCLDIITCERYIENIHLAQVHGVWKTLESKSFCCSLWNVLSHFKAVLHGQMLRQLLLCLLLTNIFLKVNQIYMWYIITVLEGTFTK